MPRPYTRWQLCALRDTLDERWPLLARDELDHWLRRFWAGYSPYSRVRAHAIRLQLDAVIALALRCGLRRGEIFGLTEFWVHHDNVGPVVWGAEGPWRGERREVPYTETARAEVRAWLAFRAWLRPGHDRVWLNLWSAPTAAAPLRLDAFNRALVTYVGPEWSLRRLRDTCAVAWIGAGMPLEHVRRLLGLRSLEAVLPYAALVPGTLEDRVGRHGSRFDALVAADPWG